MYTYHVYTYALGRSISASDCWRLVPHPRNIFQILINVDQQLQTINIHRNEICQKGMSNFSKMFRGTRHKWYLGLPNNDIYDFRHGINIELYSLVYPIEFNRSYEGYYIAQPILPILPFLPIGQISLANQFCKWLLKTEACPLPPMSVASDGILFCQPK